MIVEVSRSTVEEPVFQDDFELVAKSPNLAGKRPISVRRMMIWIALLAGVIWLTPPAYLIFDFMIGGPYLSAFSMRYLNRATDAQLVGRPEEDIVPILGKPTAIRIFDQESEAKAFIYSPVSYFPVWTVHVQCSRGVVTSVEPWDD